MHSFNLVGGLFRFLFCFLNSHKQLTESSGVLTGAWALLPLIEHHVQPKEQEHCFQTSPEKGKSKSIPILISLVSFQLCYSLCLDNSGLLHPAWTESISHKVWGKLSQILFKINREIKEVKVL